MQGASFLKFMRIYYINSPKIWFIEGAPVFIGAKDIRNIWIMKDKCCRWNFRVKTLFSLLFGIFKHINHFIILQKLLEHSNPYQFPDHPSDSNMLCQQKFYEIYDDITKVIQLWKFGRIYNLTHGKTDSYKNPLWPPTPSNQRSYNTNVMWSQRRN